MLVFTGCSTLVALSSLVDEGTIWPKNGPVMAAPKKPAKPPGGSPRYRRKPPPSAAEANQTKVHANGIASTLLPLTDDALKHPEGDAAQHEMRRLELLSKVAAQAGIPLEDVESAESVARLRELVEESVHRHYNQAPLELQRLDPNVLVAPGAWLTPGVDTPHPTGRADALAVRAALVDVLRMAMLATGVRSAVPLELELEYLHGLTELTADFRRRLKKERDRALHVTCYLSLKAIYEEIAAVKWSNMRRGGTLTPPLTVTQFAVLRRTYRRLRAVYQHYLEAQGERWDNGRHMKEVFKTGYAIRRAGGPTRAAAEVVNSAGGPTAEALRVAARTIPRAGLTRYDDYDFPPRIAGRLDFALPPFVRGLFEQPRPIAAAPATVPSSGKPAAPSSTTRESDANEPLLIRNLRAGLR